MTNQSAARIFPALLLVAAACSGGGAATSPTTLQSGQSSNGTASEETVTTQSRSPLEPSEFSAAQSLLDEAGFEGTFVLRRETPSGLELLAANPALAATPHVPCSTFKIPNSLIGLETGVITDGDFTLPWDGETRSIAAWNRDHDLASAIANSVVWYYQVVARRVGHERMSQWVERLDYGNAEIGESVDTFWLAGPMAITPLDQVRFLHRLTEGELPVSAGNIAILRGAMPGRDHGDARVMAKTGTCTGDQGSHAWLVGWVEPHGVELSPPTAHFALLLLGRDASELQAARWELALRALELGEAL